MAPIPTNGAASYKFNSFQEIKSHSSILYNERMAILFYLLDMRNLNMHRSRSLDSIYEVHAILRQIYKNVRMLLRFNDVARISLNLETKDRGIYTTDIAMAMIDNMLKWCESEGFTEKRIHIIMQEIDSTEMMIKDVLQYFQYFIRPDFSQKPDVVIATEKYKEIADKKTVEQLRDLVGKSHMVDFDSLGNDRIELQSRKTTFDETTDGNIEEYAKITPINDSDDLLFAPDDDNVTKSGDDIIDDLSKQFKER